MMAAHKSNQRGSYVLDRIFDGIGRIRRASGTTDPQTFKQMDAMLTSLYGQGRHDILRLLQARKMRPLTAWAAFRDNRLETLPTGETMALLGEPPARRHRGQPRQPGTEGVWLWIEQYVEGEKAIKDTISLWRTLIEKGGVKQPMMADLPQMLRTYRGVCRADKTPAMFNRVKATVQAFLSDTLGASHSLYVLVGDVKGMKETGKRKPRPQTPDEMRTLYQLVGRDIGEPAWAMAVTGMGPKEFWEDGWEVIGTSYVHIAGEKRSGRVRDVPYVFPITRPRISRTKFEDDLAKLTGGKVQPYDFRRSFAVWMSDAGIPTNRRKHYRGHSPQTMADLYERVEISHYLAEDAERLRKHIGTPPAFGLALAK